MAKKQLVNLTPHMLNIVTIWGRILNIEPSGTVARVSVQEKDLNLEIGQIPIFEASYGEVEGLPDPVDGTYYIVSSMVQSMVKDRKDVFSPGDLIRDDDGKPVGCRGLKYQS